MKTTKPLETFVCTVKTPRAGIRPSALNADCLGATVDAKLLDSGPLRDTWELTIQAPSKEVAKQVYDYFLDDVAYSAKPWRLGVLNLLDRFDSKKK